MIQIKKLAVSNCYFFSSILLILINKQLINIIGFKQHLLLSALQSLIITLISYIILISKDKNVSFKNIKAWIYISSTLSIMIISNIKSIYYFDITLYTLHKNCTIIIVALLERLLFKKSICPNDYIIFAGLILSSLSADMSKLYNIFGWMWMIINMVSTTCYILLLKYITIETNSIVKTVFFNNLFSTPLLLYCSFMLDNYNVKINLNINIYLLIVFSSILALVTALSSLWIIKVLSATIYCVIGASNKLVLSIISILWFNESRPPIKLFCIIIGIFCSFIYSYKSIME